jgi:hypothetical protein
MLKALLLSTAILSASASAAAAQQAQPTPAPAPAAAAGHGLEFLVGRWSASAEDPGTGKTEMLSYQVEAVAGGVWLTGAGATEDGSYSARDMWGRDPLTKEIVRLIFDGGGALGEIRSKGWVNDTLVLEGESRSERGTVRVRETITRMGPDRFKACGKLIATANGRPTRSRC